MAVVVHYFNNKNQAALFDNKSIDEYNMRMYLDNYMKQFPENIFSYTFVT